MDRVTTQTATTYIIFAALFGILVLGTVSFWLNPQYEVGARAAIFGFKDVLVAALGAKFGMAVPSSARKGDESK